MAPGGHAPRLHSIGWKSVDRRITAGRAGLTRWEARSIVHALAGNHAWNYENALVRLDFHNAGRLLGSTIRFGSRNAAIVQNPLIKERISTTMWKPTNQPATPGRPAEPERPSTTTATTAPSMNLSTGEPAPVPRPVTTTTSDQATIGKSLVIKGEVTGSESLYIDGRVEGSINLSGNR